LAPKESMQERWLQRQEEEGYASEIKDRRNRMK
jgi:hypothetical protein